MKSVYCEDLDSTESKPAGRNAHVKFALFFVPYAAFLLFSLPRFGPIWDVIYEFPRATAYVSHMLGEETPSGVSPWHHLSYEQARSSHGSSANGCLPSLIAASTGKLFFEKLRLLNHIDGYHLGLVLLWLLFVVHFHSRLTELHGPRLALLATVLLALAPRIVAHVPNNMKDIPALAFGTAALLELAVALTRERPRRIYLTALLVGCAMSSKFVAGIIAAPGAVLVCLALRGGGLVPARRRAYVMALISIPVITVIVLIAHWPYLWVPPATLWVRLHELAEVVGYRSGNGASTYPFIMAVITTPILMLAGLMCAAVAALWKPVECSACPPSGRRAERSLLLFYAVWMLAVLAAFSSGRVVLFDGVRHFILFMPPLAVLSAWGILRVSDAALARVAASGRKVQWSKPLLLPLILIASIIPIVRYHPYEITYFNGLVGGLPGATEIRFGANVLNFEPRDYWGTSIRASMDWANEHLPQGAAVWISVPPDFSELEIYRLRADLVYAHPKERDKRRPHFLIFINRQSWLGQREKLVIRRRKLIHQEEIQGIPLSFVYRLPKKRKAKPALAQAAQSL